MVRSLFLPESKAKEAMTGRPVRRAACDGELCLFDVAHGFNEQRIGAGCGQRGGLRGKSGGNLAGGDFAGDEHFAGGTDRGKDQRLARGAARDCYAGAVDGVEIGYGDVVHGDGVGAEGVCEDDLATCFRVGAGYGFNAIGMGEVPGVGFCAGRKAAGLQLGPPGAVGDEKAVGEPLEEGIGLDLIGHAWLHSIGGRLSSEVGILFSALRQYIVCCVGWECAGRAS